MTARLVFDAVTGGSKLLVKSYAAVRRGRGQVKDARKLFYRSLVESGVPEDVAKEIAETYASIGLEMLSIRKLIALAQSLERADATSSGT